MNRNAIFYALGAGAALILVVWLIASIDLDVVSPIYVVPRVDPIPSNDAWQSYGPTDTRPSLSGSINTWDDRIGWNARLGLPRPNIGVPVPKSRIR